MKLHELQPSKGACHKKKRVGRGSGSGHGATSGRGDKGQNARSGRGTRPGFEGGQMPLMRRLPKRGFNNARFATVYSIVNISTLEEKFNDKKEITLDDIYTLGFNKKKTKIKVLGNGDCSIARIISAHAFSETAKEKITKAGGEARIVR